MSETQPDLREALARDREAEALQCSLICVEQFLIEADFDAAVSAVKAARDRLSALQAEVERLQKDKRELAMEHVARDLGDESHFEAVQKMGAEIASLRERLQKIEGERERGRVTSSPCWSDKPEPHSVSALRATITSRGPRWHDQTILHSEATRGNCMQAAVASILGLPMRDVPHFAARPDRAAHLGLINFAASHGFDLVRDDCHKHFEGLYLGCGPTARGTHHMVVMRDGEVFHDPHPSRAGLHSVEFVYTFLPLDPATHVAACEAAKTIPPLLAKASEGPWSAESLDTEDGWGPCRSSEIQDAAGKTVLDALNSGVACMAEEADEDGRIRYDEQGAADTAYVVALDGFARRLAATAPCDRSGEADETRRGSAEGESTVTGAARQAPSDNPLTETKEGSDAR